MFCKTLELNRTRYAASKCQVINKDIRQLQPREIEIAKCDFIIGGPPCQSFSAAGRRAGGIAGITDSRGSLFEHYCRLIEHYRPRGFLFENVRGILSANKRRDWERILAAFGDLGYRISHRVLDAADYGVPQYRERLILVGSLQGEVFRFPRPTHGPDSASGIPHVSCREAIASLSAPDEPMQQFTGKYGELLEQIPPGMNYHFFTKELGHPNPVFAWRSRFSDFLYKAHPDFPTKTIVARLGKYSGPFHWKNRRFTFAEYKRLFTFPDDYQFAGPVNTALQQLGNSVAPAFGGALARAVAVQFFGCKLPIDLLPLDSALSFDRRKREKAQRTRRQTVKNKNLECPLFDRDPLADSVAEQATERTYHCGYSSWKKRVKSERTIEAPLARTFEIGERVTDGEAHLKVSRILPGRLSNPCLLTYHLRFHHSIGAGLRSISCELNSPSAEDIVAGWDAIEDYLCSNTSYLSLVDVFGHFTEPHPIFDLELVIGSTKPTFLLQFAKHFSTFSRLAVDCPSTLMDSFGDESKVADFLGTVKWLRSLRFDIRVFETNSTISPGYFRCCYPFPQHIDKQISVSWVDRPNGNAVEPNQTLPTPLMRILK